MLFLILSTILSICISCIFKGFHLEVGDPDYTKLPTCCFKMGIHFCCDFERSLQTDDQKKNIDNLR